MRLILFKTLKVFALAFFLCGACVNAWAQTTKPASITVQLGAKEVVIPNPDDFEEAMLQFESIKKHFTMTEAPENDTLAAHFPKADCENCGRVSSGLMSSTRRFLSTA